MIKTAIENQQNLIVEGCYIPFNWQDHFDKNYLSHIRYYCLVMSEDYIRNHFSDIKAYASVIEQRLDDSYCSIESVLEDNAHYLQMCEQHGVTPILIDQEYDIHITL